MMTMILTGADIHWRMHSILDKAKDLDKVIRVLIIFVFKGFEPKVGDGPQTTE